MRYFHLANCIVFIKTMEKKMKKKLICLLAMLIISCMMFTSCITSMFGEAGITQKPEVTQRPLPGDITTSEDTGAPDEPVFGSKPSYSSVKLADHIKVDYKGLTIEADFIPPEITDKVLTSKRDRRHCHLPVFHAYGGSLRRG